jgi:hypothetical protein
MSPLSAQSNTRKRNDGHSLPPTVYVDIRASILAVPCFASWGAMVLREKGTICQGHVCSEVVQQGAELYAQDLLNVVVATNSGQQRVPTSLCLLIVCLAWKRSQRERKMGNHERRTRSSTLLQPRSVSRDSQRKAQQRTEMGVKNSQPTRRPTGAVIVVVFN